MAVGSLQRNQQDDSDYMINEEIRQDIENPRDAANQEYGYNRTKAGALYTLPEEEENKQLLDNPS